MQIKSCHNELMMFEPLYSLHADLKSYTKCVIDDKHKST